MSPLTFVQAEAFFKGCGFQIVTGSRYLRDFVGNKVAQNPWLEEKVEGWQDSVYTLDGVAYQHLQTAYAGL